MLKRAGVLAATIAVLLSLRVRPASADTELYGVAIAAIDAASAATLYAGVKCGAQFFSHSGQCHPGAAFGLMAASAGGYLLGGPIVHGSRDRWLAAGASLALRAGLPTVGAIAADKIAKNNGGGDSPIWPPLSGMAIAVVVDWFVLARDDEPATQERLLRYAIRF